MDFNLKIWRQKNASEKGHFETYHISGIEEDASFLEMLDRGSKQQDAVVQRSFLQFHRTRKFLFERRRGLGRT